jgi:type III pantothenate kinase
VETAQLTALNAPGLEIRYANPARLGADRVAHALAAKRFYGAPVIAVSFGTAVTIDAVDARGRFIGGAIAPGIAAWGDYLSAKTAQLPRTGFRPMRRFIGRGTEEAIRVGCVHGFQGMVSALVRGARAELGGDIVPVVATGGDAPTFAWRIPEIAVVHRGLALDGLRIFWSERVAG